MNRRRMSVTLVAAATTALALVSPAQAVESNTDPAPQENQETTTETAEDGSSFMGPMDLVRSIAGGYGSSGVPEDENTGGGAGDVVEEEEPELPDWAGSLAVPEQLELPLAIITALLSVGATVAQVAAILLPILPGGVDMLRDLITSLGIPVPSDNA